MENSGLIIYLIVGIIFSGIGIIVVYHLMREAVKFGNKELLEETKKQNAILQQINGKRPD